LNIIIIGLMGYFLLSPLNWELGQKITNNEGIKRKLEENIQILKLLDYLLRGLPNSKIPPHRSQISSLRNIKGPNKTHLEIGFPPSKEGNLKSGKFENVPTKLICLRRYQYNIGPTQTFIPN